MQIGFLRALIGMLTLTVILCVTRQRSITQLTVKVSQLKYHTHLFFVGLFEASLPFYLIVYGQQFVISSVAALIIGLIPIITMIMAITLKLTHE